MEGTTLRMARNHKFKYISKGLRTCIFDFVIPEVEQCSWDFRCTQEVFDFYSHKRTREELYDLEKDPGELNNLIDDPGSQAALEEMRTALAAHLEATNDPYKDFKNEILLPEMYETDIPKKK